MKFKQEQASIGEGSFVKRRASPSLVTFKNDCYEVQTSSAKATNKKTHT